MSGAACGAGASMFASALVATDAGAVVEEARGGTASLVDDMSESWLHGRRALPFPAKVVSSETLLSLHRTRFAPFCTACLSNCSPTSSLGALRFRARPSGVSGLLSPSSSCPNAEMPPKPVKKQSITSTLGISHWREEQMPKKCSGRSAKKFRR